MKYLIIFLTAFPLLANAEQPARIGRLFLTPAERANLDVLRQNSKAPDKVIKANEIDKIDEVKVSAPVISRPVVMNGYISRSDGKNTLWVNDKALTEKNIRSDLSIDRLNKDRVRITVNSRSTNLKPGQVYDPSTGKIYNHISEVPQTAPITAEDAQATPDLANPAATSDVKQ